MIWLMLLPHDMGGRFVVCVGLLPLSKLSVSPQWAPRPDFAQSLRIQLLVNIHLHGETFTCVVVEFIEESAKEASGKVRYRR